MGIINLYFRDIADLPKDCDLRGVTSSEDIKITGFASVFFKTLFSAFTLAVTWKATVTLMSAHVALAAAVAGVGLLVLWEIANYRLGTKVTFENGEVHEGIFKNGMLVRGKLTKDDTVLEGSFDDGKYLTHGKKSCENCLCEGYFYLSDLVHGIKKENGVTYTGIFDDSENLQLGEVIYPNGMKFEGSLHDDSKPMNQDDSKPMNQDDSKPMNQDDSKPMNQDDSKLINGLITFPSGRVQRIVDSKIVPDAKNCGLQNSSRF